MRKLSFILALVIAFSCTNKTEIAKESATNFLNAYINYNYDEAAKFCTPDLCEKIKKSIDDYNNLDESVKNFIAQECSNLTPKITSAEQVGKSDTIIVNYQLVKALNDSTTTPQITSTLKIANGKIFQLNK
jgi:hypothetical protein